MKLWALTSVLLLTISSIAQADTLERVRQRGFVMIGVQEASIPFSYRDQQGKYVGYTVDICMKIVELMRRELKMPKLGVEFLAVAPNMQIDMIKAGKVDLECSSTTNTQTRQKEVAFSYSTYVAGVRFAVKADSTFEDLADFRGKSIAVTSGGTAERLLRAQNVERTLGIRLVPASDSQQAFDLLQGGKVVGQALDDALLYGLISRSPNPGSFRVVGKPIGVQPSAVMFARDDPRMLRVVDSAVGQVLLNGEIRDLYSKWFMNERLRVPMSRLVSDAFRTPSRAPAFP